MSTFQVIVFTKKFNFETSYQEIPQFWDEVFDNYFQPIFSLGKCNNEVEQAILENKIGEFGVCIDEGSNGEFKYMIARKYNGCAIPKGMDVFEFPEHVWAKYKIEGPMPKSLQDTNTMIFREWLPNNPEYKKYILSMLQGRFITTF